MLIYRCRYLHTVHSPLPLPAYRALTVVVTCIPCTHRCRYLRTVHSPLPLSAYRAQCYITVAVICVPLTYRCRYLCTVHSPLPLSVYRSSVSRSKFMCRVSGANCCMIMLAIPPVGQGSRYETDGKATDEKLVG